MLALPNDRRDTDVLLIVPSSGGGEAARQENAAKLPLKAQTGWSKTFLTTPSAPDRGCLRRHLLEVASTPPLEEGTICFRGLDLLFGNNPFMTAFKFLQKSLFELERGR